MFKIELDGTASIHDQICSEISRLISVGVLAPDEKLPAVRETAKALGGSAHARRIEGTSEMEFVIFLEK